MKEYNKEDLIKWVKRENTIAAFGYSFKCREFGDDLYVDLYYRGNKKYTLGSSKENSFYGLMIGCGYCKLKSKMLIYDELDRINRNLNMYYNTLHYRFVCNFEEAVYLYSGDDKIELVVSNKNSNEYILHKCVQKYDDIVISSLHP